MVKKSYVWHLDKLKIVIIFYIALILVFHIKTLNCHESDEDELKSSEVLSIIMKIAPTGIGVVKNRVIVSVNDYILELTGYSEDELLGQHAIMLYPTKEESEYVGEEKYKQIAKHGTGSVETRWRAKDGTIKHILLSSTPINLKDYSEGVIFTALDITERKIAEQELLESETRFKALHEASFGGITIHDKGVIVECNQGLADISGYTYEELIGMDGLLLISEKTRKMVLKNILSGYEEPYEAIGIRKNGEEYPVRLQARNIPYKGKQLRTVEFRDITNQKNLENRIRFSLYATMFLLFLAIILIMLLRDNLLKLRKTEYSLRIKSDELNRFFNSALDLLCIADLQGNFIRLNKEWENTLGYSIEELQKSNFFDFIHPDDVNQTLEAVKDLKNGKDIYDFTNRYRTKDNSYRHIEWRSTTYNDLTYAAARDITERLKAEQEILSKNKELEKLIYIASHDLRTPLVNVSGYSKEIDYLLLEISKLMNIQSITTDEKSNKITNKVNEITNCLSFIRKSAEQMDNLLKGLLKYSRSGRTLLEIKTIDMNHVINEVKLLMDYQISKEDISLFISDLPPCRGDETQLLQIFNNLIDNSIKYKKSNEPCIIRVSGKTDFNNSTYCIEDNGVGIAPENQEKIFDLFYRVKNNEITGEGLGLSIVKQIVERLNGEIKLESTPNFGSKFYIILPTN